VFDNVAYPLRIRRKSKAEIKQKVEAALRLVEMEKYAERPAPALSGGQQQRVAVARALAASEGREYVIPDDVKALAPAVLRHRLILHPDAEIEGVSADDCVDDILREAKVPKTAA